MFCLNGGGRAFRYSPRCRKRCFATAFRGLPVVATACLLHIRFRTGALSLLSLPQGSRNKICCFPGLPFCKVWLVFVLFCHPFWMLRAKNSAKTGLAFPFYPVIPHLKLRNIHPSF